MQLRPPTHHTSCVTRRWVERGFRFISCLLAGLSFMASTALVSAEETNRFSLGARSGFSSTDFGDPFWQTESFMTYDLAQPWSLYSKWTLTPRLEGTLGDLSRNGENGFIGTLGPELVLRFGQFPVVLDTGIRLTLIGRLVYDQRDFGYPLEFTSHAGLEWVISSRWKLGYRFQHMSNAGLGRSNPGVNMNLFGVGYRF